MDEYVEIEYRGIEKKQKYDELICKVIRKCFEIEKLEKAHIYVSVILTTPDEIQKINQKYRNINEQTDVLSFPMFEKEEIKSIEKWEVLGDIIISIDRVKQQANDYGHSFKRELSYMIVHGFYHLMGEDHIKEEDKVVMREKEERVLSQLCLRKGMMKR